MFFYLHWHQENLIKSLREEHVQTRVLIRALEARMDYLAQLCLAEKNPDSSSDKENDRHENNFLPSDPLLHLNFGEPSAKMASTPDTEMKINI